MLFWFKVFSSVTQFQRFQTQGLSPVTSQEWNHRTRRTHGNQSLLFPCVPWFPWFTKPQGLSPVTSREFNHRTRRTHGNQSLLFPWFLCIPWLNKPRDCPWLPAKNLPRASEGVTRVSIDLEVHRRELASAFPGFRDTPSDFPGSSNTARRAMSRHNTQGDFN